METKTKKNNELMQEIDIPEGIHVKHEHNKIIIEKLNEKIEREINPAIEAKIEGNKLIVKSKKSNRKEKRIMGSLMAHIKNAFDGLDKKFLYKLQVASVHFPVTITHDKSTNELVVKNFLGEKKERRMKITDGVEVKINKDIIELESSNIEKAGQSAANIEKGTKIKNRDRRIFQDGIFIIEKPGRSFL